MFNMQWRSLVMLLSGIAVIYIAVLLQDTPYAHPETIYTSNTPLWKQEPDKVIISTVGSFVYITSIQFEVPTEPDSFVIGTIGLKLGVNGVVKQYKKPISNLLSERELIKTDGWTKCFEHSLNGHISKISKRTIESAIDKDTWHFAVLYHQVDDVNSYHFVRVYYTVQNESGSLFEYKDVKLPGTTWINAISLEKDSLLFSRDPDNYEFHIITLPQELLKPPHSKNAKEFPIKTIRPGRLEQEWSQPASTEKYSLSLNRLYSPVHDTYRVLSFSVHETKYKFYVNFTIADNLTRIDTENKSVEVWIGREKGDHNYTTYNEEFTEHIGFADISTYENQRFINNHQKMPELHSTLSVDSKTIVFPYVRNSFVTMDYTDRVDILQKITSRKEQLYYKDQTRTSYLDEYFYWQPPTAVDADIMGVQIDEEGETLAVWTEYQYVYIYNRRSNETKPDASYLERLFEWLDNMSSTIPEEERNLRNTYFPTPWELTMAVSPVRNKDNEKRTIGAVHHWKNIDNERFIFVAGKDGNVNSYRIDRLEPEKPINFWSFAEQRWDMLFAMSVVIATFVYNEYQRPPY